MDPHLRTTQPWNRDYNISPKEAYHEARINGYTFPLLGPDGTIGTSGPDELGTDELDAIAFHPPMVNFRRYMHYRELDMDQLEELFPAVVDIIGANNITDEDLFYYATRGWIPEYDSINLKIDRYEQYDELSEVSKSLIDMIYKDQYGYVNSNPHWLEPTILAYDMNMDDDSVIRSIGERINVSLPEGSPTQDSFYDILLQMIEQEPPYRY